MEFVSDLPIKLRMST